MRTETLRHMTAKLFASSALVALIAGAPATVKFDSDFGVIAIKPSIALAKGGDSDSGSGGGDDGGDSDSGSDSSGSGSGGSDDGGNSGSGSDSSGSGSGGDDDHDNSGPGSGDDDHDNSGPGSGDDDHDNSGPSHGDDNDDDDDDMEREFTNADGTKVEVDGNNIEITFPDGTKVEIENGVFERKNAAGRTVEERPATEADIARLSGVAASIGSSASAEREFTLDDGTKVEVNGNDIEVEFTSGWKEEIEGDRFEMKDPNGNTVVERPATDADRARLGMQIPN